jgi:hypothetical protein
MMCEESIIEAKGYSKLIIPKPIYHNDHINNMWC